MPSVKKIKPIVFEMIDREKVISALEIYAYEWEKKNSKITVTEESERRQQQRIDDFYRKYGHSDSETRIEIWRWYSYVLGEERDYSLEEIYDNYIHCLSRVDSEPMKVKKYEDGSCVGEEWVFKSYFYEVKGLYSDYEIKLLILEDFDRERRYFEKLHAKFNQSINGGTIYERPRIPENIRVEVWRRDGGKCARCGSREKLEYDHIVPISKGGSNTARNIELLCEKCNRSKSNNVV